MLRTSALASATTAYLVLPAKAQDAATGTLQDDGATVLQDIVVNRGSGGVIQADGYVGKSSATGAKTDTPFIEIPQSISSVTEQQLKDRNPQTLLETLAYTPGTRVGAYGFDPRFDAFFVRGFDVTYNGVFRDNLRQPGAGSSLFKNEPYGLEGVSILRGPSSALYGATGAGGLYNLITKRPTEEAYHEVQAVYGTDQRYQGQFDLSGPVNAEDPFYYRMTGLFRDANTDQMGVPDDRAYIAPAFMWKPDEDTKLTILGEYSRTKTGGTAAYYNDYFATGLPLITDFFSGDPSFNDSVQNQGRIGWEFEHTFDNGLTFRQNFRLSQTHIDAQYVYGYQPVIASGDGTDASPYVYDFTRIDRMAGVFDERLTAAVMDNQLEAKFDTGEFEHTLLVGIDAQKLRYHAQGGEAATTPLNLLNPNYGGPITTPAFTSRDAQDQWQLGPYIQDQIRYDAWTLTVGGRYDWVWTDSDTTNLTTGATNNFSQDDRAFSGRIGLTYETEFGLAPYASYSTAFAPNVGISDVTGEPFKSTESTQQEIGIKYLVPNTNLLLTAAAFNIDQDNGLFWEVIGSNNTQVQRGKLRSRGIELEATASLDNGLSFTAAYSYTNLKILEGSAGTVGNYVSSTPFNLASLWTDYKFQENSGAYGLGMGFGARYIGKSYGSDYNTFENDAKVLFDAAVSFDFGALDKTYDGLSLQVNATNLFDRRDVTCSSNYCYRDQGRAVIGSLRYTW
ncbi:TonB-dependent siderophore receptor [Rhizobium sp. Root1220]|uniref:TonB-dependent siderophore receptor n=1 Tax=Rhizobium sp. Root1220 TaxID=1736432 RepID=UPI001FCD362B|nr:TonB-dependent siderophore receptor [Rhizobium sp. Root1220]